MSNTMDIRFYASDASGGSDDEIRVELPCIFAVCDTCGGAGKHSNPSIDGNGITSSEWADEWDEDEREAYLSGGYDVQCEECHGLRVVKVVDEAHLTKAQREDFEAWQEQQSDIARWAAEDRRTQRMEAGGGW